MVGRGEQRYAVERDRGHSHRDLAVSGLTWKNLPRVLTYFSRELRMTGVWRRSLLSNYPTAQTTLPRYGVSSYVNSARPNAVTR